MKVLGYHIVSDFYRVDERLLKDKRLIKKILMDSVKAGKFTLIHIHVHKFGGGGGVSGIAFIGESHISIHTWPEHQFASVDIDSCKDKETAYAAFNVILNRLKPKDFSKKEIIRGV